jgi:uncharacterized protein (DUF302 family)
MGADKNSMNPRITRTPPCTLLAKSDSSNSWMTTYIVINHLQDYYKNKMVYKGHGV